MYSIVLLTVAATAYTHCPIILLNKERSVPESQNIGCEGCTEEKNILIVKQVYADFSKGDIPSVLDSFTENADFIQPGEPEVPLAGIYHGREQISKFINNLIAMVEFTDFEPQEFIAKGNQVIALGYYEGRSRSSGRTFASDWVTVFRIDNGKISRYQTYHDTSAVAGAFPQDEVI